MTITWDTPLDAAGGGRRRGKLEVCRCGHTKTRHEVMSVGALCNGGRGTCQCAVWAPILKSDDARDFMFGWKSKEDGGREEHPLVAGVRLAMSKGRNIDWLTDDGERPKCDAPGCGKVSVGARYLDNGLSAMVCEQHTGRSGS